jgi:hypothetical protein
MSPSDMRCPGQNTMFWKPEDIFDVACPGCGKPVEFWKDDAKRTCECGHRFSNPKRDLGCLAYCQYAENCMPEMFEGDNLRAIYRDRLIAALRGRLSPEPGQLRRLLEAAELAEETFVEKGGEPKVVIGASIISSLLRSQPQDDPSDPGSRGLDQEEARSILSKVGTEPEVIDRICKIAWYGSGDSEPD